MPKKHTVDFIKKQFEKEDYVLLSSTYVDSSTSLIYKCPKDHIHKIRFNDWKKGYRYPRCNKKTTLSFKYRLSELVDSFSKEGFTLLSNDISSVNSTIKLRCPKGHEYVKKVSGWLQGNKCPFCSNRVRLRDREDEIKESLFKEGYLFKGFLKRKIKYICKNGHCHAVLWTDWLRGVRCPCCYGNSRKNIDFLKKEFNDEGYTLVSNTYGNCYTKLYYICPRGHQGSITWNDWQQGCRCRKCSDIENSIRITGEGHPNWQGGISFEPYCVDWNNQLKNYVKERDGFRCLNPYCLKTDSVLVVHHTDYNKKNCSPDNLITVCKSCNGKANKDRKWHTLWYRAILQRRYSYE